MRRHMLALAALVLVASGAQALHAQSIRSGFYDNPMPGGEDNYTGSEFGFDINYYGAASSLGVICTNGYVILGGLTPGEPTCAFPGPLSVYSAPDIPTLGTFYGSLAAPYFTDAYTVDPYTNLPAGRIWTGTSSVGGWNAWGATWAAVGGWYGPTLTSSITFQMVLIDQGAGNFIMEFNYGQLDWEAEGGIGWFDDGGVSGQAKALVVNPSLAAPNGRLSCLFADGTPTCSYATVVPEPSTIVLVGTALFGLLLIAGYRRRQLARRTLPRAATAAVAVFTIGACTDAPSTAPDPSADALRVRPPVTTPTAPPLQYVVLYHDGATALANPTSADGATRLGQLSYVNGAVYANVLRPESLRADPNVASVTRNIVTYPTAAYPTTALYWTRNWQWDMRQIGADQVPTTVQGQNTRACIIDSGVDGTHQDLAGRVVASESFVTPSRGYPGPGASPAPLDSNGHGSHVAGTVTSNGIGIAPVAPGAGIMAAKVFAATGGASLGAIWDAMEWCVQNNADVINMSLGAVVERPAPGSPDEAVFLQFRDVYSSFVQNARENGVVVVATAGNDALNLGPSQPYEVWPAQLPGVINVGATAPVSNSRFPFALPAPSFIYDERAPYSGYGVDVDIYAPGGTGYINRVQSNITSVCSSVRAGCETGRQYISISGTSMAAPHVTGVATLITSRLNLPRGLERTEHVEQCLLSTGDPIAVVGLTRPRLNARRAATESCGMGPA